MGPEILKVRKGDRKIGFGVGPHVFDDIDRHRGHNLNEDHCSEGGAHEPSPEVNGVATMHYYCQDNQVLCDGEIDSSGKSQ